MLVTRKFEDFTAKAVLPNNTIDESFTLSENMGEKGTVLFFYPLDFTFVCPSEIIAFDKRLEDFKSRGINVVAVSVDSEYSHLAWKKTAVVDGGIGNVQFPIVSDMTKEISYKYDVLLDEGMALRGSYLIDSDGTVRHAVINDLPLGRNIDEMIRMVDTMLFTNQHGEVCPAGWNKGDDAMNATPEGVAGFLSKNSDKL